MGRNHDFREDNVGFLAFKQNGSGEARVLAIYDVARLTQMVEKAQLNPYASSQEALKSPPPALGFVNRLEQARPAPDTAQRL